MLESSEQTFPMVVRLGKLYFFQKNNYFRIDSKHNDFH